MKIALFATATAAVALLGGAAYAQDTAPKPPTPGSVTGDWNSAHSPTDDKQYTSKVTVPVGSTPSETVAAPPVNTGVTTSTETTTAAADVAAPASTQAATVTTTTVTNGPVPDTAENRAKYGSPMSRAGKRTAARGN